MLQRKITALASMSGGFLVAEEIDALGIPDEHAMTRQLQWLLLQVVKWPDQSTHRTPSGRRRIRQGGGAIAERTTRRPSLRDFQPCACP